MTTVVWPFPCDAAMRFSEVLEKGAKSIVLASHLGRPDGSVVARSQGLELEGFRSFATSLEVEKFSMAPVAKILEETNPCHQNSVVVVVVVVVFCRYRLILVDIGPYLKCTFLDTFIIYKLYHMIQMIHRMHMMHLIHMMHIMIIMI